MQSYPLYEKLAAAIEKNPTKTVDVTKLYATINGIATGMAPQQAAEHFRELGALIYYYHLLITGGTGVQTIPFSGTVMKGGKGTLYRLPNFPPYLQRLLAEYVEFYGSQP